MTRKQKPEIVSRGLGAALSKTRVGSQMVDGVTEGFAKLPKLNYNLILVVLLVVSAFLIGRLSAQVEYLKSGGGVAGGPATGTQRQQEQRAPTVTIDQVKGLVDPKKNIVFGDKNKKLIFVEFSDPSCPYCHIAGGKNPELNKQVGSQFTLVADGGSYIPPVPEIKKLVDSGKAAFVWLYANGHGNGEMATKALYCAYEKGQFWSVHDSLMSDRGYDLLNNTIKNDKTKSGELAEFLKSVISASDMKKCLDGGKYDNRIADDMKLAADFGSYDAQSGTMRPDGTPNFYVNGQKFTGAYSFKDMQSAVDAAWK